MGQTYQAIFENARSLLKQNRFSEALQEAGHASQLDSSQWGAYFVAGTALVELERQAEAINQFQAALIRAPEQAKPTIDQAIVACRQILANRSQSPTVVYSPPQQGGVNHAVAPAAVERVVEQNYGVPIIASLQLPDLGTIHDRVLILLAPAESLRRSVPNLLEFTKDGEFLMSVERSKTVKGSAYTGAR